MLTDIMKDVVKVCKTLTLLYVEDDEQARASTLKMLDNFFDKIVVAVDGQDGVNKFLQNSIDIIITDINMPNLNGIEMLKQIKGNIPTIVLSAHNDEQYFLHTIKLGVEGYIIKPIDINQIISTLQGAVEKITIKQQSEKYKYDLEQEVQDKTKEIQNKLYYDYLTGLLSRYSFFKDIENIKKPIIAIIDINKFKIINEIYGTKIGSVVLKEFAIFLQEFIVGTTYKAYRLSGDEFILLDYSGSINKQKYKDDIKRFFNNLQNFKVTLDDDYISIDITMGISMLSEDAYECAKIALDYAQEHKSSFKIYSIDIDKRKEEHNELLWKQKIRLAVQFHHVMVA